MTKSTTPAWRRQWEPVVPFFAFPPEVRRIIYSTNLLERLNKEVKRHADVVGIFPSEQPILRLIGAVLLEQNHRYMQTEPRAFCDWIGRKLPAT